MMEKNKLDDILKKHVLWISDDDGERADLSEEDLRGADLRGADLSGAVLDKAFLFGAVLDKARLFGASLFGAILIESSLRGADLRGAILIESSLRGADLSGAYLPHYQIPQEGDLIVYKATAKGVAKLKIPHGVARTANLINRKCRSAAAFVVETASGAAEPGKHNPDTVYTPGKWVFPDKYDDDIRVDCSHGIHFFLTRQEAEEWL
jgi:hypothetical protein